MPKEALIAMSGGVDSSVAAALLAKDPQIDRVIGITLVLTPTPTAEGSCTGDDAVQSARDVAHHLGIEHHVINGAERFLEWVLKPSWQAYCNGRTPNPCVLCNPSVKFHLLLETATKQDVRWIATGHHARVEHRPKETLLLRGHDSAKDQSYFLFGLSIEQLKHTLFPVGGLTKTQVRKEALSLGLSCAKRPESQDACFGGGIPFAEALQNHFGDELPKGRIVDSNGKTLGQHSGIHRFTIGQRRGHGVATGKRSYVTRLEGQTVTLSSNTQDLLCRRVTLDRLHWLMPSPDSPVEVDTQIRYRHLAAPSQLVCQGDTCLVEFVEPQQAVTPGQAAVFYRKNQVVGGGRIQRAWPLTQEAT